MLELLKVSFLIPAIPFAGSILVGILLLFFNRTINRLTKPVSIFLIICVLIPTLLSLAIFQGHISGIAFTKIFSIAGTSYSWSFSVDDLASIFSFIGGLSFLFIMILSLNILERKKGYVRFFVSLGILAGLIFTFVFSGETFHGIIDPYFMVF